MGKIPKIIHYCWVGGNPKPQSVLYCIESWKKFCPDYEIREWNESNYDFTKNEYMRQAYEAKKWGFVPDYARLDLVYQYGGIYLDTDVEMVRPFDELLEQEGFMGFENTGDGEFFVNCGHGFGAAPHNEVIRQARDLYDHLSFLNDDGTPNLLASPHFTTQSLLAFGLKQENKDQQLDGMMVYASDVLCPKNFRTGKLSKTSRTVSIHHFTASWVDAEIKKAAAHQQKIRNFFGTRLGSYVLYAESVFQKYPVWKIPKVALIRLYEQWYSYAPLISARLANTFHHFENSGQTLLFDTGLETENCGDHIIMENCLRELPSSLNAEQAVHVSTHALPDEQLLAGDFSHRILCGTNILSCNMRTYGLWHLPRNLKSYHDITLMGVGFDSFNTKSDCYTRLLLHGMLSKKGFHSVRDSFAARCLESMGIHNVLYTGCPTMWGLTPEHCAKIPVKKAERVIATVTDYLRDPANDSAMLNILLSSYDEVFLWLQGKDDLSYIRELGFESKLTLVGPTLEEYDKALSMDDLDYVGTRLHAGIRALSAGHRSLVVSIDNRAACIASDTGLPVIQRSDVPGGLKNRVYGDIQTDITMPWDNIKRWKDQFQ